MQIETSGILINMKPFSERDAVAYIFTQNNGVLVGMLRGAMSSKKNRPLIGQVGNVSWNARLDSQLGVFHWEPEKNLSALLLLNSDLLTLMNSAFALIYTLIPERESYEHLYSDTIQLLQNLPNAQNPYDTYLKWEISLLKDLGYALDLTKCSGCGKSENLYYLSPKTGRAVCIDCGKPYMDKLYKLPINLNITERFIRNICDMQGTDFPTVRKYLKI
ncbi:MAG: DNA repair protein RecO [Alphaproteobacteria bacterium]|nr:DNA repair protein RecO [Alphaproteobacteria bacterium]